MITLTEKAVDKVKEFADSEGIILSIRASLVGAGCSGYKNNLSFDNIIKDNDEVIIQGDIQILIDELSFQYLDGCSIDFRDGLFESGFVFLNPNITGSCGCGESISF